MASIFGYEITKKKRTPKSFAAPENDDGAANASAALGGAFGQYLDLDGSWKNEIELINKYRDLQTQAEVDAAIDDIVNEAIVISDDTEDVVKLELNELGAPDSIKDKIHEQWQILMNLLDFNKKGYDLFRKWYVDGRIYFHVMVDEKKKREGIQEIRLVDPRKIRKIRDVKRVRGPDGVELVDQVDEYYVYYDKIKDAIVQSDTQKAIRIHQDAIAYGHSGLFDHSRNVVISHLHKAIKPINQLRMMEDAVVIYRIARSPERRIFYIDVGNLPKAKAEQYLKDTMNRYQNKLIYDANTGELKDDRKHMSMLEDFWLPRREGGRGTEIDTLPGGQSLGEMEDVLFFQTKVYKALNVPPSRLEQEAGFSLGRESEITRDELKFSKFITRLRNQFNTIFDTLLRNQLILKGIIKAGDWIKFRPAINYEWAEDSYYREIKNSEILAARLDLLGVAAEYSGRYFSMDYLKRNILLLNDEEIRELQKEIDAEVDGGKLSKGATIEWGGDATGIGPDQVGSGMQPSTVPKPKDSKPQNKRPVAVTDRPNRNYDDKVVARLSNSNEMNGDGEYISEIEHINTLEQLIEDIGE